MNDYLGPNAPHLREPDPEPDGAMEMCAYVLILTVAAAAFLVGWLCL